MNVIQKCRAVCAAVAKPASVVDTLTEAERSRLAGLYDSYVGPAEELPGLVAEVLGEARGRLEAEAKATDASLDEDATTTDE